MTKQNTESQYNYDYLELIINMAEIWENYQLSNDQTRDRYKLQNRHGSENQNEKL